jgi:hypothetical protein
MMRATPSMTSPIIERASAADMMELANATTPAAAQIGAILILTPAGVDIGKREAEL